MMRKNNFLFLTCVVLCTWLGTLLATSTTLKTASVGVNEERNVLIDSISKLKLISQRDSIKKELIEQVENYIYRSFPKTHKTIPTKLVEIGLEKEVDILFIMAQTQIETSFGTAGAGRESSRRSLFGVAKRKYSSYNDAIDDYVAILKKSYLTRGRTEQDLMRRYTTVSGYKYAGNPNYEAELRNTYSIIKKRTDIKELQDKYRKL